MGAGPSDQSRRSLPVKAGMNRYVWNLRSNPPESLVTGPHPALGGAALAPLVLPGRYQVRLTVNGNTLTQPLVVKMDPEVKTSAADLGRQYDLVMRIRNRLNDLIVAANQIHALRQRLGSFIKQAPEGSPTLAAARDLDEKAEDIENAIYEPDDLAPEDIHNYPVKIRVKLIALQHAVDSADTGPTPQSYQVFQMLDQELSVQLARWKEVMEKDIPTFDKLTPSAGLSELKIEKTRE